MMTKKFIRASVTVAAILFLRGARADELELVPVADVSLVYSSTPPVRQNLINGGKAPLGVSLHSGAKDRGSCSLLRFDLSSLPKGAKITGARLILVPTLTYSPAQYVEQETLCVYQLCAEDADWVEGTGESLKDPMRNPITTPGANGAYLNMESYETDDNNTGTPWLSGKTIGARDFEGDKLGALALSTDGLVANQSIEINLAPAAIQTWLQQGGLAQAGLLLWMEADEAPVKDSRFAIFHSREGEMPPKLVLTFSRL